jgi:hypothetical protein
LHRVALLLRERRHRWAGSAGRGIWHGCKVAIVMAAARTAGSWRTLPSVAGVTSTPQDVVSPDPCHHDSPPLASLAPARRGSHPWMGGIGWPAGQPANPDAFFELGTQVADFGAPGNVYVAPRR